MTWRMHLLILIVLLTISHAKEETKKALIISVDELKPEESDAIISDLTINEQRTIPTYQRIEKSHTPVLLQRAPLGKLDYILVHPEDLKVLKNLEGVTVEKPKYVSYPESSSSESYETGRYPEKPYDKKLYSINAGYPRSPSSKSNSGSSKYPSRPAPPITGYSGGYDYKEEQDPNDSPYSHKGYHSNDSPNTSPYKTPYSNGAPKVRPISEDVSSTYGALKPSSYSDPSSYSVPGNTYGSSKPNSYSGTSSYSSPGSSKSSSYSGPSSYGSSKPSAYSGSNSADDKPSSYSGPPSYSPPTSYGSSKPNTYSDPSTYGSHKPSSYSGHATYGNPKPNSYSNPSSYTNSKPSSYSDPPTYSGPSSYTSSKPSSYSGPSTYDDSKPSSYSGPSTYDGSKPSSYSGTSSYSGPESSYGKSKPNSYSDTSSYSRPGNSYPESKPPSYSGPSSYSRPPSTYHDSSAEKIHSDSEKYIPPPNTYDHPDKPYSYDEYVPPRPVSHDSSYETDPHYTPTIKPYEQGYYDSPSVTVEPAKHISYDDISSPHSNHQHSTLYNHPDAVHIDDHSYNSHKDTYSGSSKPSYGSYYRNAPPKKNYISPSSYEKDQKHISYDSHSSSKPYYGKKSHDASLSHATYKPRVNYNGNYNSDSYYTSPSPIRPHSKKYYGTSQDPSSYEETDKTYDTHRPPSYRGASEVSYDTPSTLYENYPRSTSPNVDEGNPNYDDSGHSKSKVKSAYHSEYDSPSHLTDVNSHKSPVPSKYEDSVDDGIHYKNPSYPTHSKLEYGARYPTSYRKTRHTDSKINHPTTSHFTLEDARSPNDVPKYETKSPGKDIKDSHTHYHHYHDDSSEIPDNHSAKKNYSPVRPAPLHDQLEQPRYPPLPRRSKGVKNKQYYDSEEVHSKESDENYRPESSYTATDSYNPDARNNEYHRDSHKSPHTHSKTETSNPTYNENNKYYSDHSSEETDDEPRIYTKTITTTYTKPYKDVSIEQGYSSGDSYKPSTVSYPRKKSYRSKKNDFVSSQPVYSRPSSNRDSQRIAISYSHPKTYTTEGKNKEFRENKTVPISYSSLSEILPPKRVEGVVYRSRQSYPYVKSSRRYKGFLPYKHHYPESSIYDNKPYESLPSEVREKNVTKERSTYVNPEKSSIKSNQASPKKHLRYSSVESQDQYDDSSEESSLAAIPGEPGKDYPVLKEIPHNHFTCDNKLPGFYADVKNRCQVYYQCSEEGRLQSFLCPNGTVFNQLTFVCEWWHNVDCAKSEKYFAKNNQLYKPVPRNLPRPSKNKRTVKEKYVRPLTTEMHTHHSLPPYYAENSEEFNKRKIRSNKGSKDMHA